MEFKLEGSPYIELKALLKVSGFCSTGGEAKQVITEGQVKVDGEIETRKARKIQIGHTVEFQGKKITVVG